MSNTINADDGIISGIAGLKYSADTSGALVLQTNGTTAITISASQVVTFAGAVSLGALTTSGNLTFTGSGNRILGDFSNATAVNRVSIQSSTTNGNTIVNVIPNGTATNTQLRLFNAADPDNASMAQLVALSSTEIRIASAISGTGTYLPMTFYTGGSERMRIDTSGNVGIGTTTMTGKLNVAGNLAIANGGWFGFGDVDERIAGDNAGFMQFFTSGTEKMRIDVNGQVGIGVVPYAWRTSYDLKVVQVGPVGFLYSLSASAANNQTHLGSNYYLNSGGSAIYINSDYATEYIQYAGTHIWSTAPSGTAGGTATLVQTMLLDASNNLIIGSGTTANARLQFGTPSGDGTVKISGDGTNFAIFRSAGGSLYEFGSLSSVPISFQTNAAERMRIYAAGQITKQYQPGFLAIAASGTTWTSGTTIVFANTQFNTGSCYSTSTGYFTAPVAGVYTFTMGMLSGTNSTVYRLDLYKNGAYWTVGGNGDWSEIRLDCGTAIDYLQGTKTFNVSLNAGDYVYCRFQADDGTSISTGSWGFFSGYLLG